MKRPTILDLIGFANGLFGQDQNVIPFNTVAEIANANLTTVLVSGEELAENADVKVISYASYCYWDQREVYISFGVTTSEDLPRVLKLVRDAIEALPEGTKLTSAQTRALRESIHYTYAALTVSEHAKGRLVHLHYLPEIDAATAAHMLRSGATATAAANIAKPDLN